MHYGQTPEMGALPIDLDEMIGEDDDAITEERIVIDVGWVLGIAVATFIVGLLVGVMAA